MCENESQLKEENENIKELFSSNGNKTQFKHLKEVFTNFIKNSKNDSKYFIKLLDLYSKSRSRHHCVSIELVECIYSSFPKQINEIKHYFKSFNNLLKFIIFPEEFPINENKEQQEMFSLLQKDDIDGFISFLSKNPTIDITKEQEVGWCGYYYYLFNYSEFISLIDV